MISTSLAIDSKLPWVGTTIFTVMSKLATDCGAINLSQGFPDFQAEPALFEAVTRAMNEGRNQYPPMAGMPELRQAIAAGATVFVVEGEKDADALAELGLAATTNHGGAGQWTSACSRHFAAGAKVVVIADNDRLEQDHA